MGLLQHMVAWLCSWGPNAGRDLDGCHVRKTQSETKVRIVTTHGTDPGYASADASSAFQQTSQQTNSKGECQDHLQTPLVGPRPQSPPLGTMGNSKFPRHSTFLQVWCLKQEESLNSWVFTKKSMFPRNCLELERSEKQWIGTLKSVSRPHHKTSHFPAKHRDYGGD